MNAKFKQYVEIGAVLVVLSLLAGLYYYRNQLDIAKAKTSISDTTAKTDVLDSKFNDAEAKDKELANKVIKPSSEPADEFWDRVTR